MASIAETITREAPAALATGEPLIELEGVVKIGTGVLAGGAVLLLLGGAEI